MNQRIRTSCGLTIFAAAVAVLTTGCGSSSGGGLPQLPGTNNNPFVFTSFDGPGGSPTTANGINSNNAVVGFTTKNNVNSNFIRNPGGTFAPLTINDPAGMANGMNSANSVVGVANGSAFLLSGATQTAITVPGAKSSIAFGINDNGTIVGQYVNAAGATPGFVDTNGIFATVNATPTATVTNVQSISNSGTAIGFYSADGVHQHGFAYDTTTATITLIPDPSTSRTKNNSLVLTQFLGINNSNIAVGYYQTTNGSQYGFLYNTSTGTYTYVDEPLAVPVAGVQITQITGINDADQFSGFYVDAAGVQHGFVGGPAAR